MDFTDEQLKVIEHQQGHALVSAVAGSGKTEVLVQRVKYLIENLNVSSDNILILMFNKSAQEVFSRRLSTILVSEDIPAVLTFHALGLRIISIWHERNLLGYPEVIDDEHYWISLAREACSNINLANNVGLSIHTDQIRKYITSVELLKNIDFPNLVVDPKIFGWTDSFFLQMTTFFHEFEKLRKLKNVYGLNDLLHAAVNILRCHPQYADEWRDSLTHILVDEYQDSNSLQQWLIERFTHTNTEIMVVGDEDQCIYSWRAANPLFMISEFERSFSNTTRYHLSKTFRYGHAVALMANHVLQYNKKRSDKLVVSALKASGEVKLFRGDVFSLQPAIHSFSDADVFLVRAFQHADDVEWLFQLNNVSYKLEGSVPFCDRFGGKVLRVVLGCALYKNYKPSVIDAKSWIRWVDPECSSVWVDYVSDIISNCGIEDGIHKCLNLPELAERQRRHLVQMLIWNGRLHDASSHKDCLASIARRMTDAWSRAIDNKSNINVIPLVVRILMYLNTLNWTISMVLEKLDNWSFNIGSGPLITSIHRAKGGGWNTVVLPHLEKGYFPNIDDQDSDIEEERRLYYVAITRAKHNLYMVVPEDSLRDTMWDYPHTLAIDNYDGPSSRFLVESLPFYSQTLADSFCGGHKFQQLLTSVGFKYEKVLNPDVRKSKGLFKELL